MIKAKYFDNKKLVVSQITGENLIDLSKNFFWLDLESPTKSEMVSLEKKFDLHPLTIDNCLNGPGRPKIDDFSDYLFIVFKYLHDLEINGRTNSEQISFYLTKQAVITIHKKPIAAFKKIEEILQNNESLVKKGSSYIFYLIIDQIVDDYFPFLDKLVKFQEKIEKEILSEPKKEIVNEIFILKKEINNLYHLTLTQSEIINRLSRGEFRLISKNEDLFYFRHVHDHLYHLIEQLANYKDMITSSLDAYLSSLSNKMNEIMKVLTVIATIVMPLTLVAGIYGMNFRFMPELDRPWGYPFALSLMFVICLVMITYFKKRKWI